MPDLASLYSSALEDYKSSRFDDAITKLRKILEADPRFEDACEALSVILYNQKSYDEATDVLKQWIAINPDALMAHTNLSRCYVAKGMIAEAETEQAEARRLTWKAELKSKNRELPKIDYEEQITRFKKIIDLDPADVLGYFSLGNAYAEAGKKREAWETFEKAVEVDPMHSASYYGLGMALESLGDFNKAKAIYEKGIGVADKRGDMMTQNKMKSRLRAIEK